MKGVFSSSKFLDFKFFFFFCSKQPTEVSGSVFPCTVLIIGHFTPFPRQLQWCRMADLSLADALTEPPPEIEGEIKRDFIATLEAEAYDDVVGETVGKTDYIPLLDVDEKTGNLEAKKKPCPDPSQVEGK